MYWEESVNYNRKVKYVFNSGYLKPEYPDKAHFGLPQGKKNVILYSFQFLLPLIFLSGNHHK